MPSDFVERTLRSLSDMEYTQWAALGGAATATYAAYRRYTRISLDDVPGPENPSFLYGALHSFQPSMFRFRLNPCTGTWNATGNMLSVWNAEAGKLEDHYLTTYGSIVRWKGPFGVREFLRNRTPIPPRSLS